jgi:hypothetical protein
MDKIMQQKISADHLLYVSLKYTKTTDVILNLLSRWSNLINSSIDKLLEKAKKNKKIEIPKAPKQKIDLVKKEYKKNKDIIKTIELFDFFRKIENLEKTREHEFRKNVALNVKFRGEWIRIDLDKLKEYSEILDNFIISIKKII